MSLLSDRDREQLREVFDGLTRPVRLRFFTQTFGCDTCADTGRLLDALVALSPKLSTEECNLVLEPHRAAAAGVDRAPAIAVVALREDLSEVDYGIRFVGLPGGYEFSSLVEAIQLVSSGDSQLTDESRRLLATLLEPVTVQVFVTPSCSHCPKAVSLAHRMAVESERVTSFSIEVSEFPDLIRRYRVNGVPKTVVNDRNEVLGAQPESLFLAGALHGLTGTREN
jgi:glutaredoxin-like protein